MLEIDCSYGEGGGQIVRSALALAALTNTDIKLTNIRANRPKPGLAPQHITAVKAVGELCKGKYSELQIGKRALEFRPGKIQSGRFSFDIGTAGSITLVLQACLPAILLSDIENELEITIRGGTDVSWSPQFDYLRLVFLEHLKRIGIEIEATLLSRGYYPKGGGEVILKVKRINEFREFDFTYRGRFREILAVVHSRNLPAHVPERIAEAVSTNEKLMEYKPINIRTERSSQNPTYGEGTGIVLVARFENSVLGRGALGKKGLPAERVGAIAVENLFKELNSTGAVDIYAADQLIPYLVHVGGEFTVRELSEHTRTNIWLTEQFYDKRFRINKQETSVNISF